MTFYIFHRHRVCLVDRVDLICSLYSWWEGFGSSFLAILLLGFDCGFISTSTCGSSTGVQFLRLPWKAQVCPCEAQVWKWCSCLGHRVSGSTEHSEQLEAKAAITTVLQKGIASAYTLYRLPTVRETGVQSLGQEDPLEKRMATHSSVLAWRIPHTEKLQSMGSQRVGQD